MGGNEASCDMHELFAKAVAKGSATGGIVCGEVVWLAALLVPDM